MSINRDLADWGQYQPVRKNLIINGGFNVAQRGTTFGSVAVTSDTLDRWTWAETGTAVLTISQQSSTSNPDGPNFWYGQVTNADVSISSAAYAMMLYKIEGKDTVPLKWDNPTQGNKKDITLSFWTGHTITGTYCVSFRNSANNRSYVAEYTQSVANTWEKHVITVPAPTDGTWLVTNGVGLQVSFAQACGTSYQAPAADTWYAANYLATSSQVNNMSSTSNRVRVAGVQLEVGTVATDFQIRPFADELALCQRYYEKSFNYATTPLNGVANPPNPGVGTSPTTSGVYCSSISFRVTKRATPTITYYRGGSMTGTAAGLWHYYKGGWIQATSMSTGQLSDMGFLCSLGATSVVALDSYLVRGNWDADAEL